MVRGLAQLIFRTLRDVSNPFCFLIFEREERANEIIKSKIQSLFQCGAEASSSLKRNKWGQPVGGDVYAGFELELAGAER